MKTVFEKIKNSMKDNKKELLTMVLFFGISFLIKGPGIYPDSQTYINMQAGREPVYPIFLYGMRAVFGWIPAIGGIEGYLWMVALIQSVFALWSCMFLYSVIRKLFNLKGWLAFGVLLCTLLPYIMTPIASISHMILQTSILTEGLCFPLYTFFLCFLVMGMLGEKKINYLYALLLTVLLVLIRNQMLVALAIWCVAILYQMLRDRSWKYVLVIVTGVAIFFTGKGLGYKAYNSMVDTGFAGSNSGSYNLLTTIMYLAEEEDIDLLTDEYEKTLFDRMYIRIDENDLGAKAAPKGILNRAYHYEDCYDVIGFDIQQEVLFNAATRHAGEDSRTTYVFAKADSLVAQMLPAFIPRFIQNYVVTVISGLERSVSMKGEILSIYAWIVWAIAVVCLIADLFKYRKKILLEPTFVLLLFSVIAILGNTCAVALLIMCLSRYMVYNTSIFYIALLLAISKSFKRRIK